MKWWFPMLVTAAMVMGAGCQQAQPKPAAQGTAPTTSVLDVAAPRRAHEPSVYAIPPSVPRALPASYAAPASARNAAPSAGPDYLPPGADASCSPANPPRPATPAQKATVASAKGKTAHAAGRTYLVKKGDTLFRISREQYGSGSQWRRIVGANPGLTPATLKAGQKLVMP